MKAIFSPGPSYHNPDVRKYAGWHHILTIYQEALEELGYEVFIPQVPLELIDQSSTVSKILSYDIVAAAQLPLDAEVFLGPPGYSLAQMMRLYEHCETTSAFEGGERTRLLLYVWNNQDWWRDEQLIPEFQRFNAHYDQSPTWRWINKTALELADHVIACSPWVKQTHAKVVTKNRISVNFWGVDSDMFSPAKEEPTGFRVLFVGGDPIRKGLVYLLNAVEGLAGVELVIAGCAPLPDGFLRQNPHVSQYGMLPHDKMPDLMRQCHVICIPTLEDGIALAIQEGMACGLVPVTSPETAEVFVDGIEGFRVGYRDVEGLRGALLLLRDSPSKRREMAALARRKAETQTWAETKRRFKEIIGARCEKANR